MLDFFVEVPGTVIGAFIWPRDPFILSIHHEICGIPRYSAQTTFKGAFSRNPARDPALYFSNTSPHFVERPFHFCFSQLDLANDCARNFRDPSRVVASALLYRNFFMELQVIAGKSS